MNTGDIIPFEDMIIEKLKEAFPDLEFEKQQVQLINGVVTTVAVNSDGAQLRMNVDEIQKIHDRMHKPEFWNQLIKNTREALQNLESTREFSKQLEDLDFVKERLILHLLDYNKNKALLETVAHTKFLNLAVAYRVIDLEQERTSLVPKKALERWGITETELHEYALENSRKKYPLKWDTMMHTMALLSGVACPEELNDLPMWLATNPIGEFGASVMLYPEFKEKLKEVAGRCYIIPSSQHELIIEPSRRNSTESECIKALIKSTNSTVVHPQEMLTDTLYMYDPETDEITIVS